MPVNRRFPLFAGIILGMIVMAFLVQAYHTSSNPRVCIACHSMGDVGSAWQMSNHKQFACVECHMPVAGITGRLAYKIRAGLHDLWHETLRDYPASLALTTQAKTIVNANCARCHESTVERITMLDRGPISCTRCHRRAVHHTSKRMEQ